MEGDRFAVACVTESGNVTAVLHGETDPPGTPTLTDMETGKVVEFDTFEAARAARDAWVDSWAGLSGGGFDDDARIEEDCCMVICRPAEVDLSTVLEEIRGERRRHNGHEQGGAQL
jgi:hypothetical protein